VKTHHVLIIGAGSIGERHLRCFAATGRAKVSFVEVKQELREQIANRYPEAIAHASLESALGQSIDAAVVATPAPLHIAQARELVARGISVLIEKPLSIGLQGCDELRADVQACGVVTAVAYVHRANPIIAEMRQAILDGQFGKPVQMVVVSGQNFPFYRPAYRQTYYTRHDTGGGAVQDALTHSINLGEWLVGPADRLVADLAHTVLPDVDVEDTVHVLARQGDVLASYSLNQHQAPNEHTVTVVCQRATVRFEGHHSRWRAMETPAGEWIDRPHPPPQRDTPFIRQAEAFLDALEGKRPPLCSLDEGIQTLKVNLAILESARQGCWKSIAETRAS
jgi:predicted dehydrogenase